jgi:sulfur carrier protein
MASWMTMMTSSMPRTNTISVNGETRPATPGTTVLDLLRELGLDGGRVAIERNLEILPRPKWTETPVEPGDRYEIVQFVGGG